MGGQQIGKHINMHAWARREHVFLLRAEGMKWHEIGARIGTSGARAQQLSQAFGRRLARAMRRSTTTTTTTTTTKETNA